jgi:hypothetical protein
MLENENTFTELLLVKAKKEIIKVLMATCKVYHTHFENGRNISFIFSFFL